MASGPPRPVPDLESLLQALETAFTNGVVAATQRERTCYWSVWCNFCNSAGVDSNLPNPSPSWSVPLLWAFAEFVGSGHAGCGHQVGHQTVQVVLCAVGTHFKLDGLPNPCYKDGSQPRYWKALEQQIEGYRCADPIPVPKLVVPVAVPHWAIMQALHPSANALTRATGDLISIAFYFLLWVGEYTFSGLKDKQRTLQFRISDITFWFNGNVLPPGSSLSSLLGADSATLHLSNQKNGCRGQVVHHDTTFSLTCPIKSLARQV